MGNRPFLLQNHPLNVKENSSNHIFFLECKMIQFNTMSSLVKPTVVHVQKKQMAALKSRLAVETHKLEHMQLAEALRRSTTLEAAHLNQRVHARMAEDIEFRSEFVNIGGSPFKSTGACQNGG